MLFKIKNKVFSTKQIVCVTDVTHEAIERVSFTIYFHGNHEFKVYGFYNNHIEDTYKNAKTECELIRDKVLELWANEKPFKDRYTIVDNVYIIN